MYICIELSLALVFFEVDTMNPNNVTDLTYERTVFESFCINYDIGNLEFLIPIISECVIRTINNFYGTNPLVFDVTRVLGVYYDPIHINLIFFNDIEVKLVVSCLQKSLD